MSRTLRTLAAAAALAPAAQAQDYMGMVEQYGWNVQTILRTEILNDAARQSMNQSLGRVTPPAPPAIWPAHVTEATAPAHVFTVDELAAMRHSDPDRMRALLDGRVITVQGRVERQDRTDRSFRLAGAPEAGYGVWAHWRRPAFDLPAHGATVALRGTAEMERRSYLTMREAEIVAARPVAPVPPPVAGDAALRFAPSAEVTREVNAMLAEGLAPALAPGRTAGEFRSLLDSGRLQAAFRRILAAEGFSDTDLGDVLAAHLIVLWQVANDRADLKEPRGYQAIRAALRDALVAGGWVALLTDAQKQTYAELIGTGSMLIVARYVDGKQAGDAAAVARAAAEARDLALGHAGIDLLAHDLTPAGLVPR